MRLLQRAHDDLGIVRQRQDGGVDGGGIDQRLVALDVDHHFGVLGGGHFRHAVGARKVVRAGHAYRARRNFLRPR